MATSTASPRMTAHLPHSLATARSGAELVTRDGRTLPLLASTLRAEAQGGIARLVLEQEFANPYAEPLHVTYRMPLPADGAVSGYAFEIAERVIKGVVDRKAAARERFEQAIASGRTAALLEQERADIFTQQLGNILPGERITARITVDARLAWLPEGEWELRFPTVIGPRYCGTAETVGDARATHVKASTEDIGVRLQMELAIADAIVDGRSPSSPSHQLARLPSGGFALSTGTRLDRDLVVRWPVAKQGVGMSLTTARPAGSAEAYGLVSVVPPAPSARVAHVPRDLLVLLDTSGSMGGGPLDKAKQVVAMLIDSLAETDRLELIEFSNRPSRYRPEPVTATAKAKAEAIAWVRSRVADGGTEMREAVIEALQTLRIGAQRQVLVVTDGYVGGEQQILRVLHERLPASCRLHVLGVGSAVNRSLATSLARAGRGAEVIVGIDEDAERGAKRLLDRTRQPVLTNVEIAGTALVQHAPEHVPDVFAGAPLLAALALRPEGGELVVRGQLAHEPWEQRIRVPAIEAGAGNPALAALFGRERVADLEARSAIDEVTREIEALGIRLQISTRLTSWVAIDERVRVEPNGRTRTEVVPQEVPYGTRAEAFGLRAEAYAMTRAGSMRTQSGVVFDEEAAFARATWSSNDVLGGTGAFDARGGSDDSFEDLATGESILFPAGEAAFPGGISNDAPSPVLGGAAAPEPERAKKELAERAPAKPVAPAQHSVASMKTMSAPPPDSRMRRSEAPPMTEPAPHVPTPTTRMRPWMIFALVAAILAVLAWLLLR